MARASVGLSVSVAPSAGGTGTAPPVDGSGRAPPVDGPGSGPRSDVLEDMFRNTTLETVLLTRSRTAFLRAPVSGVPAALPAPARGASVHAPCVSCPARGHRATMKPCVSPAL